MLAGSSRTARNHGERRVPQERWFRSRHKTARVVAPLLVPLALALTLGVILAVSSGSSPTTHVNQTVSNTGRR